MQDLDLRIFIQHYFIDLENRKINSKKHTNYWVTEVRSKILTPLETAGGNSISLEVFEKSLFTIKNFAQGDLHSTGGIQISIQGVYNYTGGIQIPFLGVYNSTGGI